jgi:hypothetical protein
MVTSWSMRGTVLVACNCDYGCPCNFQALPTQGKCEGQWTWHVDEGGFDDVDLSGLTFTLSVDWPGPIHHGDGEGVLLIDDRATEAQRDAIHTLVQGDSGGPWGVLGWTWPTLHGPHLVPFEVELDGVRSRVRAGDVFEVSSEPIKNPVTGAEITPGAVLPQGTIFKRADFGSSIRFRVDPLGLDHAGKYTAVGPFEYAGP